MCTLDFVFCVIDTCVCVCDSQVSMIVVISSSNSLSNNIFNLLLIINLICTMSEILIKRIISYPINKFKYELNDVYLVDNKS